MLDGYTAILNKPFQPHAVARTRHVAYQYTVVMKYLDNLIAWGDSPFPAGHDRDHQRGHAALRAGREHPGAAAAADPAAGHRAAEDLSRQLKALLAGSDGQRASSTSRDSFPFNFSTSSSGAGDAAGTGPLFGIGRTLYFCIPRNDKLLGYWDTVADRLFKIRHCMNIDGIVRPLALFDPPIDPGMLVKAAAAGIDIGSIVSGLSQPVGPVGRCPLIGKALELCAEVRSAGRGAAGGAGDRETPSTSRSCGRRTRSTFSRRCRKCGSCKCKLAQETTQSLLATRDIVASSGTSSSSDSSACPTTPTFRRTSRSTAVALTEENFDDAFAALVETYDKPRHAGQAGRSEEGGPEFAVAAVRRHRAGSAVHDATPKMLS